MFYVVFEKYCEEILDCPVWVFLGIKQSSWCSIKKRDNIKFEYIKKLCFSLNSCLTDDKKELCLLIVKKYKEVKNA